ncbi:MAG: hypothetical protein SWX82_00670 [Cyanobacteriota bacterium]|nr:hypothetical protein [Cyanobacteriota bacterium]
MLDKSLKPDFEPNNFFKSNREERLLLIKSSFVRLLFINVIWYLFFVLYSARFEEKPGFTSTIIWLIGIYVVLELVVLLLKLSNQNSDDENSEMLKVLMTEKKNVSPISEQEQTESNQEKVK